MNIELTPDILRRLVNLGIVKFTKDGYECDNQRFQGALEIGLDKLENQIWENENNG